MSVADRPQQRDEQLEVGHRGLVDDQQVGLDLVAWSGPRRGSSPSAEWIVEASIPVDSAIRRAARPVGATSAIDACCAFAAAQISRIVAVLPVPGPPVTIENRVAERGLDGRPLLGRGDQVVGRRRRRLEGRLAGRASRRIVVGELAPRAPRSAAGRPRRRRRRAPARAGRRRACRAAARRVGAGPPSSSRRARRPAPATGRQVEPSRSASLSTWITAARVRPTESRGMPAGARDRVGDREPDAEHARQLVRAACAPPRARGRRTRPRSAAPATPARAARAAGAARASSAARSTSGSPR